MPDLFDYDELDLTGMDIDDVGWRGNVLTARYGGGFGDRAVVDHPAGLHRWTLSSGCLPDDVAQSPIGGLARFDYYYDFFIDHTTGERDVFLIEWRGRKYHASFVEPGQSFERFTDDLYAGDGVEIEQRRVHGIYYRSDGSVFYPSEVTGIWSWHRAEDFLGGMTPWNDRSGNDNDFNAAQGDVVLTTGTKQVMGVTVVGTIGASGAGNAEVEVTALGMANSPKTLNVAVANNDTASQVATKVRTALDADADIAAWFQAAGGASANILLTAETADEADLSMQITIGNGTCTGLTSVTSTITTQGSPGVQNGRNVLRFNETTDDGYIVNPGTPTLKEIYLACKIREATFGGDDGIVSATANGDSPWLIGQSGTTKMFDLSLTVYNYWKDGVSYAQSNQQAPMNAFAVLRARKTDGISMPSGIQLGWDRDFAGRFAKLDLGEFITLTGLASDEDAADLEGYLALNWGT